jgi:hypothetical protein
LAEREGYTRPHKWARRKIAPFVRMLFAQRVDGMH